MRICCPSTATSLVWPCEAAACADWMACSKSGLVMLVGIIDSPQLNRQIRGIRALQLHPALARDSVQRQSALPQGKLEAQSAAFLHAHRFERDAHLQHAREGALDACSAARAAAFEAYG